MKVRGGGAAHTRGGTERGNRRRGTGVETRSGEVVVMDNVAHNSSRSGF